MGRARRNAASAGERWSAPVIFIYSGLFFQTHTLLREKQGQVDLKRPLGRNYVVVGVVSSLTKQVDRLLAPTAGAALAAPTVLS